jgi:cytochrome c-type biogenesis protein CcmH
MSARSRRMAWLLLGALSVLPAVALAADQEPSTNQAGEDMDAYVKGAARLEGRIMAPCCWMQTIDIHGSPIAEELRSEIRKRLRAGESPDAIEASFVERYGPKILAVPNSSPIGGLAAVLALGFGGAGVSAYFMLKRWSRAGKVTPKAQKKAEKSAGGPQKPDALDERLDRELSEITDQA